MQFLHGGLFCERRCKNSAYMDASLAKEGKIKCEIAGRIITYHYSLGWKEYPGFRGGGEGSLAFRH